MGHRTRRHARAAAFLLAIALLALVVPGTSVAAHGPKKKRTGAYFKATQTQDPGAGCHGEVGIVVTQVPGAVSYHVEYFDGYYNKLEAADISAADLNNNGAPLRQTNQIKKGQGYTGVTGGWGSSPCGSGPLDNSDGGRFSKGAEAWAIFEPDTYSVSGHVTDAKGNPAVGVTVEVSGAGSVVTAADGSYLATAYKGSHSVSAPKGYCASGKKRCVRSERVRVPPNRVLNFTERKRYTYGFAARSPVKDIVIGSRFASLGYALTDWDPQGGPIKITWGKEQVETVPAAMASGSQSSHAGDFRVDRWLSRHTLADPGPCEGSLVATQGKIRRTLNLKGPADGIVLFAEHNGHGLKTGELYCRGEPNPEFPGGVGSRPLDPAGGAIVFTSAGQFADRQQRRKFLISVASDETNVHVVVGYLWAPRALCVQLPGHRWLEMTIPGRGKLDATTRSSPCPLRTLHHPIPGFTDTNDPAKRGGSYTSTNADSFHGSEDLSGAVRVEGNLDLTGQLTLNSAYVYVHGDVRLGALHGQGTLLATGRVVVNGPTNLSAEGINGGSKGSVTTSIYAEGDVILNG
jgi:hypothetical protein